MKLPIAKNKSWISALHRGIDSLSADEKAAVMKTAGSACSQDILLLCEKFLGRKVASIDDLITGWNIIREKRGFEGRWEIRENEIRGVFKECGCPLVQSGLIELHPVQCLCSEGMMQTIFSQVAQRTVVVKVNGTIGRGDRACDFSVKI